MQSNRMIISSVIFLAFLSIAPSLAIPMGNYYQKQVYSEEVDRVAVWRKARFWYRIAKFSPWFWSLSTDNIRETDQKLSQSMFGMILEGADGGFTYEDHLLFLSTREDQNYWNNQEALAQLRYGFPKKTLDLLDQDVHPNADYGVMASLMTGDQDAFEKWLTKSNAPVGLYLFSEKPQTVSHPLIDIHNGFRERQTTDWKQLIEKTPPEFKALALEAYAQAYLLDVDKQEKEEASIKEEENTLTAPIPEVNQELSQEANQEQIHEPSHEIEEKFIPAWFSASLLEENIWEIPKEAPCAKLATGLVLNNSELIRQAHQTFAEQEFFYTHISIGSHVFCRPLLFEKAAQISTGEEKLQWLIYAAHAQLGQHQIALAQKTLKELEEQPLSPNQTIQELYLRARAREMASDTAGMEKYARKGLETKSPVFQSLMGKSSLIKGNKSDSIWLLHQESSNLELPPDLLQEYSDLCAIAKRFGGNAIKIKINSEDVAYGKWERSKEFRAWFSTYLQMATALTPSGTPPMPILLNNQRVDQNGLFLMRTFVGEYTDPLQISIRAMLKFNYQTLRNNSDKSEAWKEFKQARKWLSQLPFPQLLQSHSELFQIKIGAL